MASTSAQFIGGIPWFYDTGLGPVLFQDFANEMAARVRPLAPREVLELAAGTGIVSRRLADVLGPDARLTVSDLNAPMLEVARRKFDDDPRLQFAEIDATELPFQDGTFDLVVCQFGVMFFPDRQKSYREAARVLRKGGRFLFSTWGPAASNPFAEVIQGVVAKFFPVDPPVFYNVPFSCGDPAAVELDLEAAGWRAVRHEAVSQTRTIADPEGFAKALVNGNPLILQIRERGGVDPEEVEEAVLAGLLGRFGEPPISMPLQVYFFSCSVV